MESELIIDNRTELGDLEDMELVKAVNCAVCGKELTEHEKEGGNCCDECWLRN